VAAPLVHNNEPVNPDAVNTELLQLLATATEGADGSWLMGKAAAFEFTALPLLVHTARYCLLLSAIVVVNDNVLLVAQVILVQLVPFILSCHCTVGAGFPDAALVKLAFVPAHFVCEVGCVVTVGGIISGPLISSSAVLAC
jgi:hypothetical protein